MKALIKGGLFLALGCLANGASAQEPQWRVSVGQPTRLEPASAPAVGSFRPIIRAQAAEEKPAPLPNLVIIGEPKGAKPMPKDKNFPPPPTPMQPTTPSPIFDSLGMGENCCGDDACGLGVRRKMWTGAWGGGWGDGCCPDRGRGWVSAELLLYWQRGMSVPPLVTTGPIPGGTGQINDPTTQILYDSVPNNLRSGGRFGAGIWLPYFCNLGVDINYFFLARQDTSATYTSDANNQIFRPYYNSDVGTPSSELASQVTVQTFSQFWGIDANLRKQWSCGPNYWVDMLMGFRHLNLNEGLSISETRVFPGNQLTTIETEGFGTRNQFNGMQLGLNGEWRAWNRVFVGFTGKIAVGTVHQSINIDGNTTFIVPGVGSVAQRGALLAGPTNSGQYTANRFAVAPEIGLKLGVDITEHLRIYAGYDFIYLSSVLRPGDQIDLNVNPSFRPTIFGPGAGVGARQPMVPYRTSDFWAQGFNFGMQYRY